MALDWQNPNYFLNQFPCFEQKPDFQFQDDPLSLETELLCFDPLPPTLLDFHDPPPFQTLDFNHNFDHDFINVEFPPHMILPSEELISYGEDYSTQFLPSPNKKQKVSNSAAPLPCFFNESFSPVSHFNNYQNYNYYDGGGGGGGGGGEGGYFGGANYNNCNNNEYYYYYCDDNYSNNNNINNKVEIINSNNKVVSTQSKAARERRRKITEKTQELGKLIPGGHKMNTAEMLQAASSYVKFMQAQLSILKSLPLDEVKEAKLNNLPILTSALVQEKLYAKDKCIVPLDFLPILEKRCDSDANSSISQNIRNLLH